MRLRRLDLTRYGRFTDHTIDFGVSEPGTPDFHIVYGPNEAGKTTALSAFLDLLYGIERTSRYNFLHAYPAMRVGATLELGAQVFRLCRIKRPQNSLLDGNDQPLAEQTILGHLGGIDRDAYRAMFSLDDDTLEAGGEGIIASKGDLGELLFSATAGLADLSQTLINLRAEADGFHKPFGRATELADLKNRIAKLKEERDRIDTAASAYAKLIEDRDRFDTLYNEAVADRGAIHARIDELQRTIGAMPRRAALRTIQARLEPLADLPAPPENWAETLPHFREEDTRQTLGLQKLNEDIERETSALAAITVDKKALELAGKVAGWTALHARALTAEKDIPDRQIEASAEELRIASILGRIGQAGHADPGALLLDAPTTGILRDLSDKRSGIEAALETATRERAHARRLRDAAVEAAGGSECGGNGTGMDALRAAVAAVGAADFPARLRVAQRDEAACLDTLPHAMKALFPWQGEVEQLEAMPVPEASERHAWRDALAACRSAVAQCEEGAARCEADRRRRQSELETLAGVTGVGTDEAAAAMRSAREKAWAAHRRALNETSADHFEQTLRQDDLVTTARLQNAGAIAALHQLRLAFAAAMTEAALAGEALDGCRAKQQACSDEIAGAIAAIVPGYPRTATIAQFEDWLARRRQALEIAVRLRVARNDLGQARADAEHARSQLVAALRAAAVPHDDRAALADLGAVAQTALDQAARQTSLRKTVADRQRELEERDRQQEKAAAAESAWQSSWRAICDACWLRALGSPPPLAAVREILPALADLRAALDRRAGLLDRIAKMQQDQSLFAQEAAAAGAHLGFEPDAQPPLELHRAVAHAVDAATAAQSAQDARRRHVDELIARRRHLQQEIARHAQHCRMMTDFFGVATLADVASKLRDAEKKAELQTLAAEAEQDILAALRVSTMDQAEEKLAGVDPASLEADLAAQRARIEDADKRSHDVFSERSKALDRLAAVGGDGQSARIDEQRKTILLEIEEGARQYLKLRVGVIAAEHALRAYRRQHRSSMMASASEAFRMISRDAYGGLASQPKRDGEELVALGADGSSKLASTLSKGTRFQLYLALRVAGYNEFARMRDTVPFIADDIMETFDDFRAEEALRVFAAMALTGQVIYLTHHRHLCEIARRICPAVQIHNLAPAAPE